MLVPDNLKSGVNKACRYELELNPSYQQLAAHYAVAMVPARPYKAKAEAGVQLVERRIMAKLRHQTFFSLAELNQCVRALLTELNQKPFKQWPGNRQQWFEKLDQPALSRQLLHALLCFLHQCSRPLPKHAYQYTDIKTARVNIDYHLIYDHHLYSVPHHCVGEQVELHACDKLIEVYFQGKRIATRPSTKLRASVRKFYPGMTTEPGHMPKQHAQHQQWTPGRLMN